MPDEVKIAQGTWRDNRDGLKPNLLASVLGQEYLEIVPDPPAHLLEAGRAKWSEHATRMVSLRLLATHHLDPLAEYCETFDDEKTLQADIKKFGRYMVSKNGYVTHPAVVQLHQLRCRRDRLARVFGMTPADAKHVMAKLGTPKNSGVVTRKRG